MAQGGNKVFCALLAFPCAEEGIQSFVVSRRAVRRHLLCQASICGHFVSQFEQFGVSLCHIEGALEQGASCFVAEKGA